MKVNDCNFSNVLNLYVAWNAEDRVIVWFEPNPNEELDGFLEILDQETLESKATIETGQRMFSTLMISNDGDRLFSGQEDGSIQIWDLSTNLLIIDLNAHP